MNILVLAIGVEKYLSNDIQPVQFAENDASEFVDRIHELGADKRDIQLLVSNQATKSTIESKLNQLTKLLTDEDLFYFYYAGHGFSSNSSNFLTCTDTQRNDLINTSINLQRVFELVNKSHAKCSILFIDACQSGMPMDDSMRGLFSSFSNSELRAFFEKAKGTVCFSACHDDEYSHSHASLMHGVWSYHVLRALSGDAKKAIARNKYITVGSLQNYLAYEVPIEVRNLFVGKVSQTPWMTGSLSSDFPVADIEHVLLKKVPAYGPIERIIEGASISSIRFIPVKNLFGFKKGNHHVPSFVNDSSESFVRDISRQDIKDIADKIRNALREQFNLKRRECTFRESADGIDIIVPSFDYHLVVCLDKEDPSYAAINEFIDNIRDSSVILSEQFNRAFVDGFDSVEFEFNKPISVEELIDNLEDDGFDSSHLKFDEDCSYCEVKLEGYDATVRIEAYSIKFSAGRKIEPKKLFALVSAGVLSLENHKPLSLLPISKGN